MNDEKINPSNIYNKLEKQLKEFNFSHVGGSVYKSDITLSQDDVNNIIGVIIINIPELSKYVKNFYVADIGIQYDLKQFSRNPVSFSLVVVHQIDLKQFIYKTILCMR